jgi:uncharacterized protein (TIGR02996 family)
MNEKAFLEAVLANPDDDAPRLIFADWLEERGQAARAEFIRLQIRLAQTPEHDRFYQEIYPRQRQEFYGGLLMARCPYCQRDFTGRRCYPFVAAFLGG